MKGTIFLSISALFYTFTTTILFFKKDTIDKLENRIFKKILVITNISIILELSIIPVIDISGLNEIVPRFFFVCILLWLAEFFIYSFAVTTFDEGINEDANIAKYKSAHIIFIFINIILCFLIFILPIQYVSGEYIAGPAVNVLFITLAVYLVFMIGLVLTHIKRIHRKGYIPIISLIIMLIAEGIVQNTHPEMLLANAVFGFIVYLMYHTIENPDIKMLNEMSKNKEIMEQGYEDKYNFLFEMTQEARSPLVNMNNLSNALRMEEDPEKVKEGLITLNNMVRQLDFSINNILNISSLDISKIKVVDNKYDLAKMCHDLEVRIKPEMSKTVEFYLTMPKQIPTLVGDYMKIRQILYSLLINACKNTENGTINMKVNLIEKYDVARLVFNISDTGRGMSIEKINEILSATGSLSQQEIENLEKKEFNVQLCQKVVKIMGGNLMIKSNVGEGTEIILTIDQKVYHEKENSILNQYENAIANYRKVLIVSQNKNKLGIIKKKLTDNHITYSNLYYGADAIDRIKAGKKFDFILVDDEMKEMSGFMTLKGMKEVKDFDMPVIIMLGKDKENIKEHYLNDGFSDYILLDNLESELDRIIEKY